MAQATGPTICMQLIVKSVRHILVPGPDAGALPLRAGRWRGLLSGMAQATGPTICMQLIAKSVRHILVPGPDAGACRSGPDAGAYRSGRTLARPIERNGASHRPYNLHAADGNERKTYSDSWAGRWRVAAHSSDSTQNQPRNSPSAKPTA
jgi:hypothetical protein